MRRDLGRRLRESTRVEWESLGLQIGHRYEGSPICVPDGTPPPPDEYSTYIPTTRPGALSPHVWLSDGRSTLDLFGRTFVLLCFDAGLQGEADALAQAFAARGFRSTWSPSSRPTWREPTSARWSWCVPTDTSHGAARTWSTPTRWSTRSAAPLRSLAKIT